jgi:hypothetical protein
VKRASIIAILAIVAGLIGIRLATLVDDPEHLINPDPDCSICQAYQSQVLLVPDIDIISPSKILLFLNEPRPTDLYSEFHNPLFSIRAPPQF